MKRITKALPLLRLASLFISGQVLIQLVNMVVGIVLIHILPVRDYAFYTIGVTVAAIAALIANPGVTHWLITVASQAGGDGARMSQLATAVRRRSRLFLALGTPAIVALTAGMLWRAGWSVVSQLSLAGVVMTMAFLRIDSQVVTALLNVKREPRGLFWIGFIEAGVRLALTPLSWLFPVGLLAVAVNAIGVLFANRYSVRLFSKLGGGAAPSPAADDERRLTAFLTPLVPMNLYYAFQGQISVLLLGLVGKSVLIAQYGAVTRLNQIILIANMLNPFLVQPMLASQTRRSDYLRRVMFILGALTVAGAVLIGSSLATPQLWLFVLGRKYQDVGGSLVWTVSAAVVTLVGGTLYTAVISRGETRGQHLSIIPSLVLQGVWLAVSHLSTLTDALILMLIPSLTYAIVQGGLLLRAVLEWRE
jgi:O-antigen/teichoic acid export membrane protein